MAKLVACKTCGGQVANTALKCPHCGQRSPGAHFGLAAMIVGGIIGLFFLFVVAVIVASPTAPPTSAADRASILTTYCETVAAEG